MVCQWSVAISVQWMLLWTFTSVLAAAAPETSSLIGTAPAKISPQPPGPPWESVGPAVEEQSAKAVVWAQKAVQSAQVAAAEEQKIKKLVDKTQGSVPALMAEVGNAKKSMEDSLSMEEKLHALKVTLWNRAKKIARGEIPKVLKEVNTKAEERGKKEAKKQARIFEKKMQVKAKTEGSKAAKVYMDVMADAGKNAVAYAKAGDSLIGQSGSLQMNAGLAQAQANQDITVGNMAEAQKQMQQSRGDMNMAMSLNGQATGMYDTATEISSQLGAYADQAAAAAYHAQMMYDPKAVPPPPPLVLVQQHPAKGALLSRVRRA